MPHSIMGGPENLMGGWMLKILGDAFNRLPRTILEVAAMGQFIYTLPKKVKKFQITGSTTCLNHPLTTNHTDVLLIFGIMLGTILFFFEIKSAYREPHLNYFPKGVLLNALLCLVSRNSLAFSKYYTICCSSWFYMRIFFFGRNFQKFLFSHKNTSRHFPSIVKKRSMLWVIAS